MANISIPKLQDRLSRAMTKAGVTGEVELKECNVHLDYYDVSGVQVKSADEALAERAAKWVAKALAADGVREIHTGAWHGTSVMGNPSVMKHRSYGEDIVMVRTQTHSIGD